MQVEIFFESDHIPVADLFGNAATRGINFIRVPRFPGHQHLDREPCRSCVTKVDPPFAANSRQKMDREPSVSILLTNGPSPVPILMLDKVRNPIHGVTVAKHKKYINKIAPLSAAPQGDAMQESLL